MIMALSINSICLDRFVLIFVMRKICQKMYIMMQYALNSDEVRPKQCLAETPGTVDSDSGHVQSCVACSLAQLCVGWSSRSQLSVGVGGGWHSFSQLSWTKISPGWTWCCLCFCSLQISKSGVRPHHSDGKKYVCHFLPVLQMSL